MIRFLPDTWRDALLRPFTMAAPDSGVYVEIMAPDLRFAAIVVLGAIVLLALALRRQKPAATPTVALVLWLLAAFGVWMATSGNGRYFMPGLLLAGPLCLALVARLPGTAALRLSAAAGLVILQGWVLYQNNPWGSWGLGTWKSAPFFEVQVDEEARTQPATYITIANISYSLIAPQFAAESRWVNISALPDADLPSADVRRLRKLLSESPRIKLVAPTVPQFITEDGQPTPELRKEINLMLGAQRLALADPFKCRMLPSRGVLRMGYKEGTEPPDKAKKAGFWVCDLQYPVPAPKRAPGGDGEVNQVFELVENQCPRFFQPGQKAAVRVDNGWMRAYPHADLRLYVLDDGNVYQKYWRTLNPELIATVSELRTGKKLECRSIRGRSGLPWEREI